MTTPPLLPLFNSVTNPGPDCWVDALNQIINYLNTNFYYNSNSGGGGGSGDYRPISSGVNDLMTSADYNSTIGWNSATAAGKLETLIAGPIGTAVFVRLKDVIKNAGTYNISVAASGCTVEGGSTHSGVTGDDGYITYLWDKISNWMVVA